MPDAASGGAASGISSCCLQAIGNALIHGGIPRMQSSIASSVAHYLTDRTPPFVTLAIRIAALMALYVALQWWLLHVATLPPANYTHPYIFLEIGTHMGFVPGVLLVVLGFVLIRYRLFWQPWTAFDHGVWLRRFIMVVAFLMAWWYATYDYNLYFNQPHTLDRCLLLVLFVLIYWRPVFTLPFLVILVAIIGQLHYPLGGDSVAEQFLFVRILLLFFATFLLQGLTSTRHTTDFVFLVCCLMAASYWWPGLGKIRLNWITHGHLYFLLSATYANGWLGFLEPGTIATLTQGVARFDVLMRGITLLLEFGAIVFLWRRVSMLAFLGGWIAFHLGIFALSGICFWRWIVLDLCLLLFFASRQRAQSIALFTRGHFVLSLVLIAGCNLWFKPVNLSWYDARASYTYRFEAVGESGQTFALPPRFFTPYDYQFTLSGFGYLTPQPRLGIVWGATFDRAVAEALARSTSPEQVFTLEFERGTTHFNPDRATRFDAFIARFVGNLNVRRSKRSWLSTLPPPPQLWTFAPGNALSCKERITQINVYQITSFYNNESYVEIRKNLVRQIKIP